MKYGVRVLWARDSRELFVDNKYSRAHAWGFDGGIEVAASASPQVVPLPFSREDAVDPEEAFVASLSSCHMLWFLSIAAGRHFLVDSYEDNAEGVMAKNQEGKLAITEVTLIPKVVFGGSTIPSMKEVDEMHRLAHEKCFIANSVKSKVRIDLTQSR